MTNLIDLTFHELESLIVSLGEPPYRARQVWQWLWQKRCREIAAMTSDLGYIYLVAAREAENE